MSCTIKDTLNKYEGIEIIGYFDFDFVGRQDNKCSMSGYVYMLARGGTSFILADPLTKGLIPKNKVDGLCLHFELAYVSLYGSTLKNVPSGVAIYRNLNRDVHRQELEVWNPSTFWGRNGDYEVATSICMGNARKPLGWIRQIWKSEFKFGNWLRIGITKYPHMSTPRWRGAEMESAQLDGRRSRSTRPRRNGRVPSRIDQKVWRGAETEST
ncbi:hypothetical protein CR513_23468, partial [Mucuna pruriens]